MIKLIKKTLPPHVELRIKNKLAEINRLIDNHEPIPDSLSKAYRDPDIKDLIKEETHNKCAYCESKITHIDFGDIEHILPKSVFPRKILLYENLTLACGVCNTYKSDYYDDQISLINPYVDEPENELAASGPMIVHYPGRQRAKMTESKLQLNRPQLIERRIERIKRLQTLADSFASASPGPIRDLLEGELREEATVEQEYSLIVRAFLRDVCGLR